MDCLTLMEFGRYAKLIDCKQFIITTNDDEYTKRLITFSLLFFISISGIFILQNKKKNKFIG